MTEYRTAPIAIGGSTNVEVMTMHMRGLLFYVIVSFLLLSCSSGTDNKDSSTKFQQYYVKGEQLYEKHCANCHQKNGTGLGLLYPPLNKSDFMDQHFNEVICLMKFGKKGPLTVNGKGFNKEMPAIPSLTDLEIAEIATYIYNTWENKHGLVNVKEVSPILNKCRE